MRPNRLKTETWPIERLAPYARNPRRNDEQVERMAAAIKEFGFRIPIVARSDGTVVDGHLRLKAAQRLGLAEVPVALADELSEAQVKAFRLLANRSAEWAAWDDDLLALELEELQAMAFDLSLTGFDAGEIDSLLARSADTEGLTDPDQVPEPPAEPLSKPGDIWMLGRHRLMCGDSADPDQVDRLLNGQSVHLVHTDPPYNVNVEPRSQNAIAAGLSSFGGGKESEKPIPAKPTKRKLRAKDRPLVNDFLPDEDFQRLLDAWFTNVARVLEPGGVFYIWGGYANCANYPPALEKAGLYFSQTIIWVKEHPVLTRKDFMGNHEWCFYGWRKGAAHKFYGPPNVPDVWSVKKVSPQRMIHLTEKPVELAERALSYSSRKEQNVLDLFGGSGSTLIAAERTGRQAFLMEIDPHYCDLIVRRWEEFTGQEAVLE